MSVFTEKGTETDKSMTAENWKTGRHPVTIVTVSKVKNIIQTIRPGKV